MFIRYFLSRSGNEDEQSLQNFKKEGKCCPAVNLMPQKLVADAFLHFCPRFQIHVQTSGGRRVLEHLTATLFPQWTLFEYKDVIKYCSRFTVLKCWQVPAGFTCTFEETWINMFQFFFFFFYSGGINTHLSRKTVCNHPRGNPLKSLAFGQP